MTWQAGPHPDDVPRSVDRAGSAGFPGVGDGAGGELPGRRIWRPQQIVIRPRADTREAVILELLPLAAPVLVIAATQLLIPWSVPLVIAAFVAAALARLIVAARDSSSLRSRGFVGTAPAALALVSPILYLAVRGRASRGHDPDAFAPLPWVIAATIVGALVLGGDSWFEASVAASTGGSDGMLGLVGGLLG